MSSSNMSQTLQNALDDLRAERDRLDRAIEQIEGLIEGGSRAPRASASGSRRSASWSPAARRAAANRMRRYWATRKKGGAQKRGKKAAVTRKWSPAARKAAADRMRKYWADRKRTGSNS